MSTLRPKQPRIPDFKKHAASKLADAITLYMKRSLAPYVFQKITLKDESIFHDHEQMEDTNPNEQKNYSFMNESKHSDRGYSRQMVNQASMAPQRLLKKNERDFEGDKLLVLSPNRSLTKQPTHTKEEAVVEKPSDLNPSEQRWIARENYEGDEKFKLDVFPGRSQPYESSNLKMGDIVYFKNNVEVFHKKDNKPHRMAGILSGDGIASNRLECINRSINSLKNANFLFKKSLFRVEPSRKYYYQKLYGNLLSQKGTVDGRHVDEYEKKLQFIKKKYEEEKEENDSEFKNFLGQNILYGQTIHLKHLYSDCYLTYQNNSLALQYGCIELTLEEEGSESSNFKFMASGNLKTKEDVVAYSDPVHIVSGRGNYYMHVWDEINARNNFENGLEVNGSESSTNWKLLRFLDFKEYEEYETNNAFLESGDIVRIKHRKTDSALFVTSRNLEPIIQTKTIHLTNELEDSFGSQRVNIPTKFIDSKVQPPFVYLEKPKRYTVSDLWEVQRRNAFIGGFARFDETFRLKNVSTGLFLCQDSQEKLRLTADGNKEECYFLFRPNKISDKRHRIEYSDLMRIQTYNGNHVQQTAVKKDPGDLCGPKLADTTNLLFFLEYSESETSSVANRLSSLFPCFFNFHVFLQSWGLPVSGREELSYDYNEALKSEKDLSIEVDQLLEGIENLEDFLGSDDKFSFRVKQNLLIEQKIIDILVLVIELINAKVHVITNQKTAKDEEGKIFKIQEAKNDEEWELLEKTPQYIARKYLEGPVKKIYGILLLSSKNSPQVSGIIIKNSKFLSKQLGYYRQESGALLKEAIRNSAQFGDLDPNGEQIARWLRSLEMIRESEHNVELQTMYIDIISLACLDYRRKGILKYQNRVIQEFMSPNAYFLKNILTFTKRNGKVYISFGKDPEIPKEEFIESNYSFTGNEINYEEYEGKYFFCLEDLSIARTLDLELIVTYISAVLGLFYSLCKDRNQMAINFVKGMGLQSDILLSCMSNDYLHIKLKKQFVLLYRVLFIDVEPYQSIKDSANHCYLWEEIPEKKLSGFTYLWHNLGNGSNANLIKQYDREKVKTICDFLLDFWINGKGIFKLFNVGTTFAWKDDEYLEKADLIYAMLLFTKTAVNLGFTDAATNNQILYSVINLFSVFNKQEKETKTDLKKNKLKEQDCWVARFVQANGLSTRNDLFGYIYLEALEVFRIIGELRLNLQMTGFLKLFRVWYENKSKLTKDDFTQVFPSLFQKYGLNVPVPQLIDNTERSEDAIDLKQAKLKFGDGAIDERLQVILKELSNPEADEVIQTGIIFITMLFENPPTNRFITKQTRDVLKNFFDQREALLEHLKKVELICGKKEMDIYSELDALNNLDSLVHELMQDEDSLRHSQHIDVPGYRMKIANLTELIRSIIAQYKERKKDIKLTLKTQNIMRNLNIHIQILKLFNVSYREQEHKEMLKLAISLLHHFCKRNKQNQQELLPHVPLLLSLIEKKLKPSKLIAQIFSFKKDSKECHELIEKIFNKLSAQEPNYYIVGGQYMIILRNLIVDEKRNGINENQRRVMGRLMTNKNFLTAMEYRPFEKYRSGELRDEDVAMLRYQSENIMLLAYLAMETRLGIVQAKKTLSYDQVKSLLISNSTPYIQKKSFLRCLFQIYMAQWADLNLEFDKKTMIDILNSIVIPDLKLFDRFLEGVIEIPSESEKIEKQRKALELREKIKRFRGKLSDYEGRDDKALSLIPGIGGRKMLPPIAGQSESKKIVRDDSEYWEYLNSGKSWNMHQDGLLYFIIDCFHEMEERNWLIDDNLKEVLSNIRTSLTKMNNILLKIEEEINREGPTQRLTKYTVLISECIDRLPDKKVVRLGKSMHVQSDGRSYNLMKDNTKAEEYDLQLEQQTKANEENIISDPVSAMISKMKSFIIKRKMSVEDFMLLFWNTEDRMGTDEFKAKIKFLLGDAVTIKDVDEFVISIRHFKKDATGGENTISLNKVYRKLQRSLERDRNSNFGENVESEKEADADNQVTSESALISKDLDQFINWYGDFCVGDVASVELYEVVTGLFSKKKKKLTKKRLEEIRTSLGNLIKTFHKKNFGIYLLRMLKYVLTSYQSAFTNNDRDEANDDSDEEEQNPANQVEIGEFKKIQVMFAQSEALRLCVNNIREGVPKKLVLEAAEVMNLMLSDGNKQVQADILEFLKNDPLMSGFFNYIKLQLWETVDNFKKMEEEAERNRLEGTLVQKKQNSDAEDSETELELKVTHVVIKLMHNFCENCFNEFQNFLRFQVSTAKATVVSSNLVNELSSFLIDLQLADPNIFQNHKMLPLVLASLETLIDFCTGPCQENQVLLGNQRHLISFINSFIDKDINFDNRDDLQMISIFSTIVKFLLAIVNGNNDMAAKDFLLNQLHTDSLIRKLVVIYTTKIINRKINIFRQNRQCPQGVNNKHGTCRKNYCSEKFLTPGDLLITETVFNLYILLTIFTDEFPDNIKLEKFRYDQLNEGEKQRLRALQNKFKAQMSENKKKDLSSSSKALLQHSTPSFRKNMTFGKSMKIVPNYNGLLFNEEDSSGLLKDINSPDLFSPQKDIQLIQSHLPPPPPPKERPPNVDETYKIDFIKRIVESGGGPDKALNVVDKDLKKVQEEETFKELFNLQERNIMYKARKFFKTFINSVEVIRDDKISKNYFQVPFECDYMTENIRDHLIFKANRNSDVERLEYFFFNIPLYHEELLHRQKVSKVPILEWFVKRWRLFKDIAYISVFANNLILIATLEVDENGDLVISGASPELSRAINLAFSIIQISLSFIVVTFSIIERLPISLYKKPISATQGSKRKHAMKKNLAIEKNTASLWDLFSKVINSKIDSFFYSEHTASTNSFRRPFLKIVGDRENLYNLLYLAISIIAFATTPLVYSILLLDLVKRSEDLQNIIKSITHNIKQLVKTVILGLIVMYFYAIISFVRFRDYFSADPDTDFNLYCDTLLHCWTSTVNYGVRAGGGLGDVMKKASIEESAYWARWVFDLTFFVLVIIILLNIIFGIIIDTFADLRDQRNEELQKIHGSCFICGLSRYDFDTKGNGWNEHIYKEHNIYAYLNFCIYIQKKDTTECNGVEKYVKELIKKKDVSFIPQGQALAFKE